MKLGWLGAVDNKLMPPDDNDTWFSTAPQAIFARLYPNELSACIDIRDPDLDLCAKLDAAFFMSGSHSDTVMLEVIDKIPCKVLFYHEGGENDFLRWTPPCIIANYQVINKSDLVLVWDTRALGLHKLYTSIPLLWWPLPYPIEYMDRALKVSPPKIYDILIPYSQCMWVGNPRNGALGCLVAQYFIDNLGYKTAGVFSNTSDEGKQNQERSLLDSIGCPDIEVIPRVNPKEFLSTINHSSVVINLDSRRASGRITLECALTRTPVIASDQQPFAYQLYNGIKLHDTFDVSSMIDTGIMIRDGRWHEEWLDLAYERAQHYSYTRKAKTLEEAVMKL